MLNIPPDQRGLFHENDVQSLLGFRKLVDSEFAHNLARKAKVKTTSFRGSSGKYGGANLTDGKKESYWATDDVIKESYDWIPLLPQRSGSTF